MTRDGWNGQRTRLKVNRMRKAVRGRVNERGGEWRDIAVEIRRRREAMIVEKDKKAD